MSTGIESYFDEWGTLAALVIRANHDPEGITFYTPPSQTIQLGVMKRGEGYRVEPHTHIEQRRAIDDTNEVLFVRHGSLAITLYDSRNVASQVFHVATGDVVLLAAGGHGIEFVEESVLIEAKQGPYSQIADKRRFEPSS